MIKFEKLGKYKPSNNSFKLCNSCLANDIEVVMYELFVGFGDGGQSMYLCPKCAKELREAIKFRK